MSLSLRVNGVDYKDFISARAVRSIETLLGAFSFTSSANTKNLFPVKAGDLAEVLADGIVIVTGYVETSTAEYDDKSHDITVAGRGILADFMDSTPTTVKEFTGLISLEAIARTLLDTAGFPSVKVINNAGFIGKFGEDDLTSAEIGQTNFEFLEPYARKRQVLLTTDAKGNLVFARASTNIASVVLQHKTGSNDNNIKSGRVTNDLTERFYKYEIKCELNPIGLTSDTEPSAIVDQSGVAFDREVRKTRTLELNSEESMDINTATKRARWEANIRRARSFDYSCVVQGHSVSGFAWEPNTLVKISDDFADVQSKLLLRSVEYSYDIDDGSISTISFAKPDAYTLQAEEDQRQASTTETGGGFLGQSINQTSRSLLIQ